MYRRGCAAESGGFLIRKRGLSVSGQMASLYTVTSLQGGHLWQSDDPGKTRGIRLIYDRRGNRIVATDRTATVEHHGRNYL